MTILNFGSCCIDNVYRVPHFVQPGETLPCSEYNIYPGGKGLNQSLALAYAGAPVKHAGKVGQDGAWLKDLLTDAGVDTELLLVSDGPSGHANIQVNTEGENSIVLFGGSNKTISYDEVDEVLTSTRPGDFLLIQNEISSLEYLINQAASKALRIVFNAAPITESVKNLPLENIELLIINEIEGAALSGQDEPNAILESLLESYAKTSIVLTLSAEGAIFANHETRVSQGSPNVEAIDTTGAGDTFTGYFLAGYSRSDPVEKCLEMATIAAALCVTRPGAASSIPRVEELAVTTHTE